MQKNPKRLFEDMEYTGLLKKKIEWKFQAPNKREIEFPRMVKKKSCGISMSPGIWP